jgi:hypothetical protein
VKREARYNNTEVTHLNGKRRTNVLAMEFAEWDKLLCFGDCLSGEVNADHSMTGICQDKRVLSATAAELQYRSATCMHSY